jgi:hypothetical protein
MITVSQNPYINLRQAWYDSWITKFPQVISHYSAHLLNAMHKANSRVSQIMPYTETKPFPPYIHTVFLVLRFHKKYTVQTHCLSSYIWQFHINFICHCKANHSIQVTLPGVRNYIPFHCITIQITALRERFKIKQAVDLNKFYTFYFVKYFLFEKNYILIEFHVKWELYLMRTDQD